ncbi:MAG: tRNA (N6-threonylcarbamoyladenosine(37)-N6)-methyltransferase TrmO [Candidatus Njordarchaeales archaeon]
MSIPEKICFKPIGIVHVSVPDYVVKQALNGVRGEIEIFEEYVEGLEGIEEFSHIIVVAYLHKVPEEARHTLKVRPRGRSDMPLVGVFCTNSPHRPNPIAITIVKLLKRKDRRLVVGGLDLFDGTIVLDIKPYTPRRVVRHAKYPEWVLKILGNNQ